MKKFLIIFINLVLLFSTVQTQENKIIQLQNKQWTLSIQPSTLEIIAKPQGKKEFTLSSKQSDLGSIENLKSTQNHIQWDYPEKGIHIDLGLKDNSLSINIQSKNPGEFTFPVIQQSDILKALIWPRWEGCYIPIDDTTWTDYLIKEEWNTTEGFSMPFWGLDCGDYSITYLITNPYNNLIKFSKPNNTLESRFTHEFISINKIKEFGFIIHLGKNSSPVEPAQIYRDWLISKHQFVTMKEKMKTVPNAELLLGAPHAYIFGSDLFTRYDIPSNKWKEFCQTLIKQSAEDSPNPGKRIKQLTTPEHWNEIIEISQLDHPYDYLKNQVTQEISRILQLPNYYDKSSWQNISLPQEATGLLNHDTSKLTIPELCKLNCLLLYSAYPEFMAKVEDWGNGVSVKMLHQFHDAGFDRLMLQVEGWSGIEKKPEVAVEANKLGYLLGTYDSYFSIHDPKYKGTDSSWETAQFDQTLFDTGGMENKNGKKLKGFKQFGYKLNPVVARPYVEQRVKTNMQNVPYNYYFVDCDAFGEVFDDYSPSHPLTQEEYVKAMMDRISWIRDTYKVVIGSEGGNAYSAPYIHVAEGMFGPGFGWGDPDLKDKTSKYYLGGYFPPDGPKVFIQQVPIKEKHFYRYYDPRFRLPLYETVFHDSVVATNHGGNGSLKYNNILDTVELTELLYQVPPLYHMNLDEFKKFKDIMKKHYDFFSPLHKVIGFSPMTEFTWLTPDRLVQKTIFGNQVELVANFSPQSFTYQGNTIPPKSILARWLDNGKIQIYTAS